MASTSPIRLFASGRSDIIKAGIASYTMGGVPDSIWKGQSWSIALKFALDGIVYGLVVAGTFCWLWPDAG